MSDKVRCSHCKFRLPRMVCGNPQSPHHDTSVTGTGFCEAFVDNPAQALLSAASVSVIMDGDRTERIQVLEQALSLGLPEDAELFARWQLGTDLFRLAFSKAQGSAALASREFGRGVAEMERALRMDAEGSYGCFLGPLHSALLQNLGAAYGQVAEQAREAKGVEAAIAYVEEKMRVFCHLPSPPSLLILNLAEQYTHKGDRERARQILSTLVQTHANEADEVDGNVRRIARNHLDELDRQSKKSGCFVATAVYQDEGAPELVRLRRFRDERLTCHWLGRVFVRIYCKVSPPLARLIARSGWVRAAVRRLVLRPALWLIGHGPGNLRPM